MTTGLLSFGALLLSLPILIGQWVGILGLGKTGRNMAWWFMIAGVCGTTLGSIGFWLFVGLQLTGNSFISSSPQMGIYMGTSAFAGLGSLLFAIGFAIHGQQASKIHQRVTELEAIAAAQSEELDRLRAV